MDIAWSDRPPKRMAAIGWSILTIRPGPPVYVRLLGQMQGCMTHFVETDRGGQTRPCFGDACPWCPKSKQRWKGFVPCEFWCKDSETGEKVKRLRTLEIPELAGDVLADKELRGMLLKLWRKDKRRNSSLALEVIEPAHEIQGLTAPWDIRPILRRLFDVEAEEDYQLLLFRMAQ